MLPKISILRRRMEKSLRLLRDIMMRRCYSSRPYSSYTIKGVVAAYIYNRASKEYGSFQVPKYADEKINVQTQSLTCPTCDSSLGENTFKDEVVPPVEDEMYCEECGVDVNPDVETTEEDLPQVTGYDNYPKTRTKIDVFGPSYAHMPFYARKQEQIPYIRLRFEQHEALLKSVYKDKRDDIQANTGATSQDDRWARSYQTMYGDDTAKNLVTTTCQWLRPWAYEVVDEAQRDLLYKNFPNGCYAVIIDEDSVVLESRDENLDDHWVITEDPVSNYIHADPIGKPIAPVQELRNQANDLGIETFEHSIPETFADSEVLDFDKYQNSQAEPGSVYPVKAPMGRSVSDSFHSLKTATLTDEVDSPLLVVLMLMVSSSWVTFHLYMEAQHKVEVKLLGSI